MAADMREDGTGTLAGNSLDDGQIALFRAACRELPGQGLVRTVVFGNDEASRSVLVQTVNDAGALHSADAGEVPAVVEQGIHDGAVRVAGGGMHHHAAFLVDDDHVFILIQDVQRNVLGPGLRRFRLRDVDGDGVSAADGSFGFGGGTVDLYVPAFDQGLDSGAGEFRQVGGQVLVQANFSVGVVRGQVHHPWRLINGCRRRAACQ